MALICIYAQADAGKYDKYDIVEVLEEDRYPGNEVCLPKFLIVKAPGLARADVLHLRVPKLSDTLVDSENVPLMINKRKYIYNFDNKMKSSLLAEIAAYKDGWLIRNIAISDVEQK